MDKDGTDYGKVPMIVTCVDIILLAISIAVLVLNIGKDLIAIVLMVLSFLMIATSILAANRRMPSIWEEYNGVRSWKYGIFFSTCSAVFIVLSVIGMYSEMVRSLIGYILLAVIIGMIIIERFIRNGSL